MIFYFNADGTLISQTPEKVFQGSNLANTIYFVAPFEKSLQVTVNFLLPNGEVYPAAGAELLRLTSINELNGIKDISGKNFCTWQIGITNPVTAFAGKVTAQFTVYNAEQVIASCLVDFTVGRGVVPELPLTPKEDIYEQILEYLSTIDISKQDALVSGENIKTLDSQSLLGKGDIPVKTINGQSIFGGGDIEVATPNVLDGTGQSTTQAMSQKAVTDSLNDLEAKLNENIIKNPDYTYIVVNAASLHFSMLADTVEVDWGDGTTGSQLNRGNAVNINHTYTDSVKYHLITIKKLETVNGGWLVAIGESGIEAYIGTKTENFFIGGPDSTAYYSNLKRVIYAEGIKGITLPSMVKEPIVIPESCEGLRVAAIDNPPSSNITIPKIIIQSNKLLERPLTLFTGFGYIGKIVVPKEYVNAYKTATDWSNYANNIVYDVDSSDLEDKVSKFTDTSSYDRAYIQNSAGNEAAINIDGGASAYSLIRRNAGGTAKVAKGVADDDIANIENLKEAVPTFSVEVW